MSSKHYQVEKITDKKIENHITKYKVKWVGWAEHQSTWEPLDNLSNVLYMVNDFEANLYKNKKSNTQNPSNSTIDDESKKKANKK